MTSWLKPKIRSNKTFVPSLRNCGQIRDTSRPPDESNGLVHLYLYKKKHNML